MTDKKFDSVAYRNQFNREKYDRVNLTMPKGKKQLVKDHAEGLGLSVNEYINKLIDANLDGKGNTQGNTPKPSKMLQN